jgi:hypothetical protein
MGQGTGQIVSELSLRTTGNGGSAMPVVLLWAGIPILLVGSGFIIYRIVGG